MGADGAWSKVRAATTDVSPQYSGVSCITLTITNVNSNYPKVSAVCGQGSLFVCSDGKALMSQRGGLEGDYIRTYAMLQSPSDDFLDTENFTNMSAREIKKKLLTDDRFYMER